MTVPAFHVEAKLHAFRKTQEGVVVSFVVSPVDMPPQLALDPLGTRYQLALCAIGDDEQPIPARGGGRAGTIPELPSQATGEEVSPDLKGPGVRHLSPSPPLAERPGVETGSSPTARARASEMGKERFANAGPGEKAVIRTGILASDPRFQQYVASETAGPATEEHAAAYIRERCCDGKSRGLIAVNEVFWRRFTEMDFEYRVRTGQVTEPR